LQFHEKKRIIFFARRMICTTNVLVVHDPAAKKNKNSLQKTKQYFTKIIKTENQVSPLTT